MICNNCGSEVDENSVFCFNCGAKVDTLKISSDDVSSNENEENLNNNFKINLQHNFNKFKKSTGEFSKYTKDFVENTGNNLANFSSNLVNNNDKNVHLKKYSYSDSLNYIRKNQYSRIEFPASDSETKDKLTNMLSNEVVGSGVGLIGAAASIGLIGATLGTGLIIVGTGALIGSVLASTYKEVSWVKSELFIKDDELVIAGKFSLGYDEIKHIETKIVDSNEILILTLKDQAIEFRTYNALALKTVIDEKIKLFNKI